MFSYFKHKNIEMPRKEDTLPGREQAMELSGTHYVNGHSILPPFPEGCRELVVGLGCFWGAEKAFWSLDGVYCTVVGYAGGYTPNPSYEEVCSGMTGHNEVVRIIYDPEVISLSALLEVFWEAHDPTQGMRQGNDRGTQYRSGIYLDSEGELALCEQSRSHYQSCLNAAGFGEITTEIKRLEAFYYAEEYHQQYLAKNPGGYCGLGGTGVCLK
ncbi:MAG: peptide-methionine (S)-S-oxide reductase [Oleiphilus sp.]|nr:MAG: peptide-methionine (S)-S-oxide reductase [Oleiphilus sp.]